MWGREAGGGADGGGGARWWGRNQGQGKQSFAGCGSVVMCLVGSGETNLVKNKLIFRFFFSKYETLERPRVWSGGSCVHDKGGVT